jgi:hypothetical protein
MHDSSSLSIFAMCIRAFLKSAWFYLARKRVNMPRSAIAEAAFNIPGELGPCVLPFDSGWHGLELFGHGRGGKPPLQGQNNSLPYFKFNGNYWPII